MKKIIVTAVLFCMAGNIYADRYLTRTGRVSFASSTSLENFEGINNEVACILDSKTGDLIIQIPVKSFKMERALMQEHFNENYIESDKYPKSDFKGKISDISSVNFAKDGTYNTTAVGKLTIHGVTKDVSIPGTITVKGSAVSINSKFNVKPGDYNVKIPSVVAGKIAQQIEVTVNSELNKVK